MGMRWMILASLVLSYSVSAFGMELPDALKGRTTVGLIVPTLGMTEEIKGWTKWCATQNDLSVDRISWPALASDKFDSSAYGVLWIHSDQPLPPISQKSKVVQALKSFVDRGGGLLLTGTSWDMINLVTTETVRPLVSGGDTRNVKYGFCQDGTHPIFRGVPLSDCYGLKTAVSLDTEGRDYSRLCALFDKDQLPKFGKILATEPTFSLPSAVIWDSGAGRILALGVGVQFDCPFLTTEARRNRDQIVVQAIRYIAGPQSPAKRLTSKQLETLAAGVARNVVRPVFRSDPSIVVWQEDTNRRIDYEAGLDVKRCPKSNKVVITLARNEYEPCHIGLTAGSKTVVDNVCLELIPPAKGDAKLGIEWKRVGFVGPSMIEDVLLPAGKFTLMPDRNYPVWITVHAGKAASPGTYRGAVRVRAGDRVLATLPLEVEVCPFMLPEEQTLETGLFTIGLLPEIPGSEIKLPYFTPQRDAFYRKLHEDFARHRISPGYPMPESSREYNLSREETGIVQDFLSPEALERLDTWIGELTARCQWPNETGPYVSGLSDIQSRQFIDTVGARLKTKGCLEKTYLRFGDEDDQFGEEGQKRCLKVLEYGKYMHEKFPQWRVLFTVVGRSVENAALCAPEVNIWAVASGEQLMEHAQWGPFLRDQMKKGKQVYFYQHENLALSSDLVQSRRGVLACHYFGISGINLWSVVWWHEGGDGAWVLRDGEEFTAKRMASTGGVLFWPGQKELYGSIRWELLRDGVEDWEALTMLKRTEPRNASVWIKDAYEAKESVNAIRQLRERVYKVLSGR